MAVAAAVSGGFSEHNAADGAAPPIALPTLRLLSGVVLSLALAGIIITAILLMVDRKDWWHGFLAATACMLPAAGLSVLPLRWGVKRGLHKAVAGFFLASGVRAVVAIGGCLVAILALGYPRVPTLLLMVVYYFAVLAAETWLLGRAMWTARA
jgi:hypothetical protein